MIIMMVLGYQEMAKQGGWGQGMSAKRYSENVRRLQL